MDQLPRLGKREQICLLLFTCNYVVSVWRGFLVILLWHSLSQVKTIWGELSPEWGELSSECGASCLLNVGRVVLGRVFFGARCLGASCLWGELS